MVAFRAIGPSAKTLKLLLELLQFLVAQILQIYEAGACARHAPQKFIELQVKRFGVAILGVLN
jgi:hypothetical protein